MTQERALFLFAGSMIWLSVALTLWLDSRFFWFTLFIGANMIQSAFTGTCPAKWFFRRIGLKSDCHSQ